MEALDFYPSRKQDVEPISVLFVHHYGGDRNSAKAHIRLFNQLGYNCYSFDLRCNNLSWHNLFTTGSSLSYGFIDQWTDDVTAKLNAIKGKKIIYSFSAPSLGAAKALYLRNCVDVGGWIADGGPFLELRQCFKNYQRVISGIRNPIVQELGAWLTPYFWGAQNLEAELKTWLSSFPKFFPVLSVRSWQDQLVPFEAIDQVFRSHHQIELEVLTLTRADHLQGLKVEPELFKEKLTNFLHHFKSAERPLTLQS